MIFNILSFFYSVAVKIAISIEAASDFFKRQKYIEYVTRSLVVVLLLWGIFYVDDEFIARNQALLQITDFIAKALPWLETLKNNWGMIAQKQVFLQSLFILIGLIVYIPYSLFHWDMRLNEKFYREPRLRELAGNSVITVVLILLDIYANTDVPSIYSSFRQKYIFFMFNSYISPISSFIWALGFFSCIYFGFYYFIYLLVYCGHKMGLRKHF